ncbi:hypothetical protein GMRT_12628 [Giardia muris]|uniref:Uncharacterized protein n=1 Tax=Giardia muris TaxID=5742 RepID=A0A4Z1SRK2_GIAMU|nr:hypothetical protein GMRT_12628 [Giardia muris]|eukprot:TNJ28496.1 hypothetical protein GMRT_12628 [Giardia muris]
MLIPETAFLFNKLEAIGQRLGVVYRLGAYFICFQCDAYQFRTVLENAAFQFRISPAMSMTFFFIDVTINSIIARGVIGLSETYNLGGYLANFPYLFFFLFFLLFIHADKDVAYTPVSNTPYLLIMSCLGYVLDAISKSLVAELLYLKHASSMIFPFVICFCGRPLWRGALKLLACMTAPDPLRSELLTTHFPSDSIMDNVNVQVVRGIVFGLLYVSLRWVSSTLAQLVCGAIDGLNAVIYVVYYIKYKSFEVGSVYRIILHRTALTAMATNKRLLRLPLPSLSKAA